MQQGYNVQTRDLRYRLVKILRSASHPPGGKGTLSSYALEKGFRQTWRSASNDTEMTLGSFLWHDIDPPPNKTNIFSPRMLLEYKSSR